MFERISYFDQPISAPPDGRFYIEQPWWTWGDYLTLRFDPAEEPQVAEAGSNTWTAYFQLAGLDEGIAVPGSTLDLTSLRRGEPGSGNSNYELDLSMQEPRLRLSFLPNEFILHRNGNGRVGAIEIQGIEANDSHDAMDVALTYFAVANALLTSGVQVPLRYRGVSVRREGETEARYVRVYYPWANPQVSAMTSRLPAPAILLRYMTLYADGVSSNSAAYKFLCFFKIVDHILSRAHRLRAIHVRLETADWQEIQGELPDEPTRYFDAVLVGRSFTFARDRYRETELRNAVAHILPDDSMFDPLDPIHAGHSRAAGTICRWMARELMGIVGMNADRLAQAGASLDELRDALFGDG